MGGKLEKPANCCKTFTKFLLSRVGMSLMVVVYSIIGGFIFQFLEKTNEKGECIQKMEDYRVLENRVKNQLWNASKTIVNRYHQSNQDALRMYEALGEFRDFLVEFRDEVLNIDYSGEDCVRMGEEGGPGYKWSYPMAVQFSVTVITTVGTDKIRHLYYIYFTFILSFNVSFFSRMYIYFIISQSNVHHYAK